LPPAYEGWQQDLLDIDPNVSPDIVCDAREMSSKLETAIYDAVYCSHTLEHFYRHDVPLVLKGFLYVLKPGGLVDIAVPNISSLFAEMFSRGLDIDDVWYRTTEGRPIMFHDVLYGWSAAMESGNLFYAHKCGFTGLKLGTALHQAGFENITVGKETMNIFAKATKPVK